MSMFFVHKKPRGPGWLCAVFVFFGRLCACLLANALLLPLWVTSVGAVLRGGLLLRDIAHIRETWRCRRLRWLRFYHGLLGCSRRGSARCLSPTAAFALQ